MREYACTECGAVVLMLPSPTDYLECDECGEVGTMEPTEGEDE